MKIIRYQDAQGAIGYGALQPDGSALKLAGDIYQKPKVTGEKADELRSRGMEICQTVQVEISMLQVFWLEAAVLPTVNHP